MTMIIPADACGLGGRDCPPSPEHDGEGIGYTYDGEARTFYPNPPNSEGSEQSGGVAWQVRYVILCAPNTPDVPGEALCNEASCEADGLFGYYVQVYRRQSAAEEWEPWPGRERICRVVDRGEPIPLEDVEAEILAILEEHYESIARPEIELAPEVNAVVNLPVLASTDDAGAVGFDIENPLTGRVDAQPEYTWAWSNGTDGAGPGVGYDGTDPIAQPGHYPVRAVYERPGEESVALATTWSITLTVEGIPPITDIEPLVYEVSETFTVHDARTVLVD